MKTLSLRWTKWTSRRWPMVLLTTLCALLLHASPARANAGISGVGNTTDLSIQLELAREVAVRILRDVSPRDLHELTGRNEVLDLYTVCRDAMFSGAVRSNFVIRDEIPDDGGFTALAQRANRDEIWVSRREIDRLAANGTLSMHLLVVVLIHEVTHDCVYRGRYVDDAFDPLINIMAGGLYQVARGEVGRYSDLEFLSAVERGRGVDLISLSPQSRQKLTDRFLDYVGDWLYQRHQSSFRFRPAPASNFNAERSTSVFPGWAYVREALVAPVAEVEAVVAEVLQPTFALRVPATRQDAGKALRELPANLYCRPEQTQSRERRMARCTLDINWMYVRTHSLRSVRTLMDFDLDSMGRLEVRRVQQLTP